MLTIKSTGEANRIMVCGVDIGDYRWNGVRVLRVYSGSVYEPKQFHITHGHEIHHCQCLKMEERS